MSNNVISKIPTGKEKGKLVLVRDKYGNSKYIRSFNTNINDIVYSNSNVNRIDASSSNITNVDNVAEIDKNNKYQIAFDRINNSVAKGQNVINNKDNSETITVGNDEDIKDAKYLRNLKFTKNAIDSISKYAKKYNIDPNVAAASLAVEASSSGTISTDNYFNTHNLIRKQYEKNRIFESKDALELYKNAGAYVENEDVNGKKLDNYINKFESVKSDIDANNNFNNGIEPHIKYISENGIENVNKNEPVYMDRIKAGSEYIKGKNLFNNDTTNTNEVTKKYKLGTSGAKLKRDINGRPEGYIQSAQVVNPNSQNPDIRFGEINPNKPTDAELKAWGDSASQVQRNFEIRDSLAYEEAVSKFNNRSIPDERIIPKRGATLEDIKNTDPKGYIELQQARYDNILNGMSERGKLEYAKKNPRPQLITNTPSPTADTNKPTKFGLGGIDPISLGSTAISTGVQIYSKLKENADLKNAEAFAKDAKRQSDYNADSNFLKDYNSTGNRQTSIYRTGGIHPLNVRKGLIPMGDNIFYANGKSHEQGGIKMPGNTEIEGDELVRFNNGNMEVLSDSDKTFGYSPAKRAIQSAANGADPSTAFVNELVQQENSKRKSNSTKKFKLGTDDVSPYVGEDWGGVDTIINGTPEEQRIKKLEEQTKWYPGREDYMQKMPKQPTGFSTDLTIKRTAPDPVFKPSMHPDRTDMMNDSELIDPADRINPITTTTTTDKTKTNYIKSGSNFNPNDGLAFIDNAINLGLTALTPKTSRPILDKAPQLNTDINTDADREELRNQERSLNRAAGNFADSNVSNAVRQSASNNMLTASHKLNMDEINTENNLKNQQSLLSANTSSNNNNKLSDFLGRDAQRSKDMLSELSANASNVGDDLTKMANRNTLEKFQDKQMLYNVISNPDMEVAKNAITFDPESYRSLIDNNYEAMMADNSGIPDSMKKALTVAKTANENSRKRKFIK